jgi:hypothetical protein
MHSVSNGLRSARAAIDHPQCGRAAPSAVAADARPMFDNQALAILLAIPLHPEADASHKAEAADLRASWEAKCGHWRHDQLNAHNAIPQLPPDYRDWQRYLDAALLARD